MKRLVITILAVALTVAATTSPATSDLSSPKSAAKSLFIAIQARDVNAVRDALYQPDAQQAELMSARADAIVAGKKIGDAMREKFGASGDILGAGTLDSADLAKLDEATVEQNADRAKLTVPGQPRPMSFRKQEGKWRLVITDLTSASPESLAKQTLLVQMMAEAMRTSATEIATNTYKTPEGAKAAIEQRLRNVMLTFNRPSTTRATTTTAPATSP